MFHSEILSPWSFLRFLNGLSGIGRQLCVKTWFWQFSTRKINVTVCGKFSELNFDAFFFSNPREKVLKARKTLSHSFPCFSNLLPGIGEKAKHQSVVLRFFHTLWHIFCAWKTVRTSFWCIVVSQSRGDRSKTWEHFMDSGSQSNTNVNLKCH